MAAPATQERALSAAEPLLDAGDIQGNILTGFNKDHQLLAAVRFGDITAARRWLGRVAPYVSSLAQVFQFNALYRAIRARTGAEPVGLVASWFNIAFSHGAIAQLTSQAEADTLPDTSFVAGLERDRAGGLGDPAPPDADPTACWVVGGTGRVPDAFLILASDHPTQLDDLARHLLPNPAADGPGAPEVVWRELGETRPDLPGHEHFGFKDGISQPAVRGLISRRPKIFLHRRTLKAAPAGEVDFAQPGQPLIWPGNFVLGYPFTDRGDGTPQLPVPLAHKWFKNGSFLVFRRLNQNVAGFSQFLAQQAAALATTPAYRGLTAGHLGAILVGRWPSGAPLPRAPLVDDPVLARTNAANNDFFFGRDTPPPDFLRGHSGGRFPAALEGSRPVCPHAAHILKMNPRDLTTDVGPDFDTLTRRILRRGNPFGPPLADPAAGDDGVERGLHFLCYQASIVDQFEFLQQRWANQTGGPTSGGHDVIIGQTNDAQRTADLLPLDPNEQGVPITTPTQWVTPTGGGYFFAPSVSAIGKILAGGA